MAGTFYASPPQWHRAPGKQHSVLFSAKWGRQAQAIGNRNSSCRVPVEAALRRPPKPSGGIERPENGPAGPRRWGSSVRDGTQCAALGARVWQAHGEVAERSEVDRVPHRSGIERPENSPVESFQQDGARPCAMGPNAPALGARVWQALECVSKCREMQFRVDLPAFQGDFPQVYWR